MRYMIFYWGIVFFSCQGSTLSEKPTHKDNVTLKPSISKLKRVSGKYNDISIGIDSSSGLISGVYEYYDAWDEKRKEFSNINIFYFFGHESGDSIISIYGGWPNSQQKLIGRLIFKANQICMKLNEQPDGYNDIDFTQPSGVSMLLTEEKAWLQIRVVKYPQSYLFNAPDSSKMRKGYLVKGDIVKVLSRNEEWVQIEYNPPNTNKSTKAWISTVSLHDIDPKRW